MSDVRKIDGRDVHYREGGSGPRALLLHCSSSHSGQWKPFMEATESWLHTTAPDLAGYGRSAPFEEGPGWAADARMVEGLAGDAPVHLVGHSAGGALGFYVAGRRIAQVASLAMVEPVLFPLLEEAGAPEAAEGWWIAHTIHALLRLDQTELAARAFVDFWSGPGAWDATEPRLKTYILSTIGRVADDWAGMVSTLEGQAARATAEALDVPVLLVRGSETRASASRIVDILGDAISDVRVVELPGLSHMATVTHPERVMPVLTDWLEEHTGRQR